MRMEDFTMPINLEPNLDETVEEEFDMMEEIIKCPNCGAEVRYGETRMVNGYTGCDNKLGDGECFADDLAPRVTKAENSYGTKLYEDYTEGNLYHTLLAKRSSDKEDLVIKEKFTQLQLDI